jgi:hypothetical protein
MPENISVRGGKGTFGHRHIIYRIQKIGLALSVVSADAVDVRRELQFLKLYIPEIGYDYFI